MFTHRDVRVGAAAGIALGAYSLSGLQKPSDYSVAITSVGYWDGAIPVAGTPYSLDAHIGPSCPGGGDKGVQRITIFVTSSDPQVSETVQVLKRVVP